MGNKDPTPRADALREQREARYGHLQATAEPPKPRKLIPYAGKPKGDSAREASYGNKHGGKPPNPDKPPRKRVIRKRKTT